MGSIKGPKCPIPHRWERSAKQQVEETAKPYEVSWVGGGNDVLPILPDMVPSVNFAAVNAADKPTAIFARTFLALESRHHESAQQ